MNVKKNDQQISLPERELEEKQNLYSESYKTTNVNILLNRVRLDKRKTLKKRIIFSFTLISIVSSLIIYFILQ